MVRSNDPRATARRYPSVVALARIARVALARLGLLAAIVGGSVAATPAELNEAGRAAYARGDFASAETLFSQAIAQSPRDPLLHYHRAVALTRLGRFADAAREHETVLRLGPPASLADLSRQALRDLAGFSGGASAAGSGRRDSEIPISPGRGGWMVEVTLNESHSARFLVDTGAGFTVISPGLASALGIAPGPDAPRVLFGTLAGRGTAPVVMLRSIRVGDALEQNVPAAVHEIDGSTDGILGNNILARYAVTVDPTRRVLELRPR